MTKRYAIAIVGLFFLSLTACHPPRPGLASRGVLDLRNQATSLEDHPLHLRGEWAFYWKDFIDPSNPPPTDSFIAVPSAWNGLEWQGEELGGSGYASYRLRILLDRERSLAIKALHVDTAYEMYVNGELVHRDGTIGKSLSESSPHRTPAVIPLPRSLEYDIVLHVANFHHRKGGLPRDFDLGRPEMLSANRQNALYFEFLMFGALLIMGIYHLTVYALRRSDASPLFFGCLCLFIAARTLLMDERYLYRFIGEGGWELLMKLEYLTFFGAAATGVAYVREVFPKVRAFVSRAGFVFFGALGVLVVVTPARVYTWTTVPAQAFTFAAVVYLTVMVAVALYRRRPGAMVFLVGWILLALTVVHDIAYSDSIIQTGYLSPLGLGLFLFAQAFILSLRFSSAYRRVELLTEELAASEKKYRRLVEESESIIASLSPGGTIISINRAVYQHLGYRPQRMIGSRLSDLTYRHNRHDGRLGEMVVQEKLEEAIRTSRSEFDLEFTTARGEPYELTVQLQSVVLADEQVVFAHMFQRPSDALARHCLTEDCEYRIGNNLSLAEIVNSSLTSRVQRYFDPSSVMDLRLGLREILINAIEHGNLAITFTEKSDATTEGRLEELIRSRQQDERYRDRTVLIQYSLTPERVKFIVTDQGEGFDHRRHSEEHDNVDGPMLLHGRGIRFTLSLFDEVHYNEKGNEVTLIRYVQSADDTRSN